MDHFWALNLFCASPCSVAHHSSSSLELGVPGDTFGKLHPLLAPRGCSATLPGSGEGLVRGHRNRYLICRLS